MSEIIYDEFLDKLGPEDLADDIFQTLLSTPPKADREDLMQSDLSDSMNTPLTLEKSPRVFGNNSVKEFLQTKKKFSLGIHAGISYYLFSTRSTESSKSKTILRVCLRRIQQRR